MNQDIICEEVFDVAKRIRAIVSSQEVNSLPPEVRKIVIARLSGMQNDAGFLRGLLESLSLGKAAK